MFKRSCERKVLSVEGFRVVSPERSWVKESTLDPSINQNLWARGPSVEGLLAPLRVWRVKSMLLGAPRLLAPPKRDILTDLTPADTRVPQEIHFSSVERLAAGYLSTAKER